MKRVTMIGIVAVLAGSLGVAGTGVAKPGLPKPNQVAAKLCKAEKHADKAAFKATYGKHAMRECKRANRAEVGDTIRNASQQCKADREAEIARAIAVEHQGCKVGDTAYRNSQASTGYGVCTGSSSRSGLFR